MKVITTFLISCLAALLSKRAAGGCDHGQTLFILVLNHIIPRDMDRSSVLLGTIDDILGLFSDGQRNLIISWQSYFALHSSDD